MTLEEAGKAYPILQFFRFEHLPPALRSVSEPFGTVARLTAITLPQGPEVAAGLRHLLEAKDCFVRARLADPEFFPPKSDEVAR